MNDSQLSAVDAMEIRADHAYFVTSDPDVLWREMNRACDDIKALLKVVRAAETVCDPLNLKHAKSWHRELEPPYARCYCPIGELTAALMGLRLTEDATASKGNSVG